MSAPAATQFVCARCGKAADTLFSVLVNVVALPSSPSISPLGSNEKSAESTTVFTCPHCRAILGVAGGGASSYIGNLEIRTSDEELAAVLKSLRQIFRAVKTMGEGALAQLSLEELQRIPAPEMNSIAIIVKHLHGNMLSRWTDFLTTDGEKPGRDRDAEFEPSATTREEILRQWEEGWGCVLKALDALTPGDLIRTVTIRGQPHSVTEAVHRQLQHYSYHIGQIVLLARMSRGTQWKTLSIARGKSKEYTPKGLGGEPRR